MFSEKNQFKIEKHTVNIINNKDTKSGDKLLKDNFSRRIGRS